MALNELQFEVLIDPKLDRVVQDVLAFGDDFELASDNQVGSVYPSNGLHLFFADLIMGRPFPVKFVTRSVTSIGTLVAVTLFLKRELALQPAILNLVTSASLVEQLGHAGTAHVDRDLARFFKLLRGYLPETLSRRDQQERLTTAVEWVAQYVVEGILPGLPSEPLTPRILDVGEGGFVVAEVPHKALEDGWVELFRMGFLRGVLFGRTKNDRVMVLAAKKGVYQRLDLRLAADLLNEAERVLGEPPGWVHDGLWLRSPPLGTLLPHSTVLNVLIRV